MSIYPDNDYRSYLAHSAKGTHWKNGHKYIAIKNGRYIYPKDVKKSSFGKYGKGNIDLENRPVYRNEDGSISTVDSFSTNIDGEEVLLPSIGFDSNGKPVRWTEDQAIDHYFKTGEHLGKFKTPEEATKYAIALHNDQEKLYANRSNGNVAKGTRKKSKSKSKSKSSYAVVSGGKHAIFDTIKGVMSRPLSNSSGPNVIYAPRKSKKK